MLKSAILFAGICFAAISVPSAAAEGSDTQLEACLNAANANDFAMKDCYGEFADREDARLNRNWARLMKAVGGPKSDDGKILLTEQRAWLKFRDASCHTYAIDEGTLDRLMGVMCSAGIISDRADQLESLADYHDYQ